jgi:hypothetical protein
MDITPLIIGVLIAGYGGFVLWNRNVVIPFGRLGFWKPTPLGYIRMNGATAVIFALGLIFGGLILAFPSVYQLLSSEALPDDLPLWLPITGLVIIAVGLIGAGVSGILRTAKVWGDEIYARNHENKES